uniref:EH domain-containing protein n=1 Tax=Echinostoma caproni TaxID=27848 RepID=A0A183A3K6_9TREM
LVYLWKILRGDLGPELRAVSTARLQPDARPQAHLPEASVNGASSGLSPFPEGDFPLEFTPVGGGGGAVRDAFQTPSR